MIEIESAVTSPGLDAEGDIHRHPETVQRPWIETAMGRIVAEQAIAGLAAPVTIDALVVPIAPKLAPRKAQAIDSICLRLANQIGRVRCKARFQAFVGIDGESPIAELPCRLDQRHLIGALVPRPAWRVAQQARHLWMGFEKGSGAVL